MIYSGENYKIILGGAGVTYAPPALILFYQLVKKKKKWPCSTKKGRHFLITQLNQGATQGHVADFSWNVIG